MQRLTLDVGGPTSVADFGGEGPSIVLLHGLGGSHVNWVRLGPLLAERGRVLAPDMPGFGYTVPRGRPTTLQANARWVGRFIREVAGGPAIIVGNSMGGLIGMLAAVEDPGSIAGLVLLSPALPLAPGEPKDMQVVLAFGAYFTPGLGEVVARRRARTLGAEGLVRESFQLCCVDPSRIPQDVVDAHVMVTRDRLRMPWAEGAVLRASRSLVRLVLRRPGFLTMLRSVRAPTLLINGEGDRLVKVAAARLASKARADWTFRPLDDVGHLPMLEAPERTAGEIWSWLEGPGREVWDSAARYKPTSPLPVR